MDYSSIVIYSIGRMRPYEVFSITSYRQMSLYRNSRPEVFCRKDVLRNFTKFTEKRLCQSLFFNKVTGLRPATL